jgi:hypothetical protein
LIIVLDTAFKQQQLKAWQPILTPKPVIITFLVLGILFVPIGVILLTASNQVIEVSKRYDNIGCEINTTCTITLDVPEKMSSPVYMYYGMGNYFQNHRRYVKSRSDQQLRGDVVGYSTISDCDPLRSEDGSSDSDKLFLPCGLIAWSRFNGFKLLKS